ncbi:hypothetical protein F4781DRAFT_432435 [Annulohypoxylon bovei var. microspora]|nr:hypothetical protein F4781DRAFT_432435 [Annulohypoxylon bovei var. microspora]
MISLMVFCLFWLLPLGLSLTTPTPAQRLSRLNTHAPISDDIVRSLSVPGFQFRHVRPLISTSVEKKIQRHLDLRHLPLDGTRKSQRSAIALISKIQRDIGGHEYENVTSVNHYATEYAVQVVFNGIPMNVVVDSGSADTWVRGSNFSCKGNLNKTVSTELCGLGPAFPENFTDTFVVFVVEPGREYENGGELDMLVDMSQLQDLTMDLINDRGFTGTLLDDISKVGGAKWWPTAPGPAPKLEKLCVRMSTGWLARWAQKIVRDGAPLRQIKLIEAENPGLPGYTLDGALRSHTFSPWTNFLACNPQELMLLKSYRNLTSFDETTACKSIRYLATDCTIFCDNIKCLASRMPQLEGLWIMKNRCNRRDSFYGVGRGGFNDIQQEKAKWVITVRDAARTLLSLKYFRINSMTWRIERKPVLVLHELTRMENEGEIPHLFRISIPYTWNNGHAAKFWLDSRWRDEDEVM